MKRFQWQVILGIVLVLLSVVLYVIHYILFGDAHHIFIYMIGDIAFVPVEVLLVTMIIHTLLNQREKRNRLEKLNMVIGVFFSDVGTRLLSGFSASDPNLEEFRSHLLVDNQWTPEKFADISGRLKAHPYSVEMGRVDLVSLRRFLLEERDLLLRLLENPNLLEHESFTELLRAVFHLTEELENRGDIAALPESDLTHLAGDIRRAYVLIVRQWLDYMRHLKDNYPYLFSLAMRTNPFDRSASPVVR